MTRRPTRTACSALTFTLALTALAVTAPAEPLALFGSQVDEALLTLDQTDRPYRVAVEVRERLHPEDGRLFGDLPAGVQLHPSYDATVALCERFDPYNRSDEEVSDAEILQYLEGLQDTAPILEAFFVTGRSSIEDLKNAWFRHGRGFEHVVCGEKGKGNKLGGYHFWYLHYVYERTGRARYTGADYGNDDVHAGMADTRIVTGGMTMDPDGDGPLPTLRKRPRGGFTVGHSVSVLLAAGHIAFYGGMVRGHGHESFSPDPFGRVEANINGKTYPWTFHRQGSGTGDGSGIRTFWPRWVPGTRSIP